MIIYRSKINNVVFEMAYSSEKLGTIVFCDGLPSVPKQKDLMSYFCNLGFSVIYPRYRGTWESGGEFLKKPPTKDIEDIIGLIKTKKIIEFYAGRELRIRGKNIFLLGSSFGGSVALSLAKNKNVSKIIALSPIVDFAQHNCGNNEQNLIQLGGFIKKAFANGYRFKTKNWRRMVNGEIFNPSQKFDKKIAKKILIFYSKNDSSIDYNRINNYSVGNNIKCVATNDGHLSLSNLSDNLKDQIKNWLFN